VTPPRPLRPYRDFFVEYPPGAFLAFLPPALVSSTPDGYALAFKLEMALCWAFLLALLARLGAAIRDDDATARPSWPAMLAACILALGMVCTHRYDVMVAACMTAALLATARGGGARAGLWLGLGAAAKGVPLLLAPLLAAWLWFERGPRAAVRFAVTLAATTGGILALGLAWGGPGMLEAFAYHEARPIQIESTAGALLGVASWLRPGLVTVVHSFSSRNLRGDLVPILGAATGLASIAAALAALAVSIARLRTAGDSRGRLVVAAEGCVAVLAAYVALGKVFCPQYVIWLLPFALCAARAPGRSSRRLQLGLAILAATQLIYPIVYGAVKALAPWATTLVLARNVGILAWTGTLLTRAAERSAPQPARVVTDCEPAPR
jgi:hypothetical protein